MQKSNQEAITHTYELSRLLEDLKTPLLHFQN